MVFKTTPEKLPGPPGGQPDGWTLCLNMFCFAVALCLRSRLVIWRTGWCPPRRIWRRRLASGRNSWEPRHAFRSTRPQFWSCFESATANDMADFSNIEAICSWSRSWWVQAALRKVTWRILCECFILFVESFRMWMQDQTRPNSDLPSVPLDPWMLIQVLSSPRARHGRTWGHARYCRRSGDLRSLHVFCLCRLYIHSHCIWLYMYT